MIKINGSSGGADNHNNPSSGGYYKLIRCPLVVGTSNNATCDIHFEKYAINIGGIMRIQSNKNHQMGFILYSIILLAIVIFILLSKLKIVAKLVFILLYCILAYMILCLQEEFLI